MGHPLHIITSRPEECRKDVIAWLAWQGITVGLEDDDVVAAIWFTHAYEGTIPRLGAKGERQEDEEKKRELDESLKDVHGQGVDSRKAGPDKLRVSPALFCFSTKLTNHVRPKVLRAINASLFVDDHYDYLGSILKARPPIPCILFAALPSSRATSGVSTGVELMSWADRQKTGLSLSSLPVEHGQDKGLYRAESWEDIVSWVKEWDLAAVRNDDAETENDSASKSDDYSVAAVVGDTTYTKESLGDADQVGMANVQRSSFADPIASDRVIAVDFDAIACRSVAEYIKEQKVHYNKDTNL